jgi:hypothetical protein
MTAPRVEEIEPALSLVHIRQLFWTTFRAIGIEPSDARHDQLRRR